jgi:hypothetical protein
MLVIAASASFSRHITVFAVRKTVRGVERAAVVFGACFGMQ